MTDQNFKAVKYKRELGYSYAPGAFAVYELLDAMPQAALRVYVRKSFDDGGKLATLCEKRGLPVLTDDRAFDRTGQKDNCLAFGVFKKPESKLDGAKPHVTLVNPQDMGNLGSITRAMAAFNFLDLAVITPAADILDPRSVRASMGALFRIRFCLYNSFCSYVSEFPGRHCFPFMTNGNAQLAPNMSDAKPFTLVFGNEASGLPDSFHNLGKGGGPAAKCTSVRIPQTNLADSLNLPVAVGIALYVFSSQPGV